MKEWTYKDYQIREGLKPGSDKFQYFFLVSEGGEKKCNYCVWIEDDALNRFDDSGSSDAIVSSQSEAWGTWVQGKIDQGDFRNLVLKIGSQGEEEYDLDELDEHLSFD